MGTPGLLPTSIKTNVKTDRHSFALWKYKYAITSGMRTLNSFPFVDKVTSSLYIKNP